MVEVCNKNDASSKCNRAAAVCIDDSTDVNDSAAVADRDDNKKRYMCTGLCGIGKDNECSVDADIASCKVCTCDHGVGAVGSSCSVNGAAVCSSCESGYVLSGTVCVMATRYGCGCTKDPVLDADASCPADAPSICQYWNFYAKKYSYYDSIESHTVDSVFII